MLKKPITYVDYNGEERTEDFFFNLSKAELMEMELSTTGGLTEMLRGIIKSKDIPEMSKFFKKIVCAAYGIKSSDGKRFIKSEEITNEFLQTEAYSNLYMELVTDDKAAAEFINNIMPHDLKEAIDKDPNLKLELLK